ncbi:MAG: HAD-IC family P-type ATPase [Merdibacter sp.]
MNGRCLLCGNERFLAENNVSLDHKIRSVLERLRTEGKAAVLIAEEQKCIGVIALSDVLRPEAKDVVSRLSDMRVHCVLLTGDHQKSAEHLALQAGIVEVRAELLPADKVQSIAQLQAKGHRSA